jgi:integrase/recombinase XerD
VPAIDDEITTYLEAIAVEGKTAKTVASYTNSLRDFRAAGRRLGLPEHPDDYQVPHVYAYLSDLRSRGASATYQHRRHREVKACFSWLKRMGLARENVFAKVPLVKRPQVIKPPFDAAGVQALLDSQSQASHSGARNYALILFLLDSGVRASECITFTLADIDWERRRAFVQHGKGEKQRLVGFGPRTADALRHYIKRFRGDQPGALFLTTAGEAMTSAGTLEVILRRIGERAGVAGVHPHRFRHTFATWAIESGAREIDVQLLLGHADLTMTHRYARTFTSEQAVRAHPELSPVNRLQPADYVRD